MSKKGFIQSVLDLIPFSVRSKVKHIPVVRQLQAFIMKKYMNGKEFIATISAGPAKGLVFPVKLPQDKYMWIGTWEVDFANALHQYVQPGWVCYDIGGYKGYYAGVMALKGAKEVYVFEPMPANAEKINKLIELNPSLPIQLKKYAVSDSNGEATFKLMAEETMGKLETSSFQKEETALTSVTVETITLDQLVANGIPAPDFIKIDVEGAEEFVLKGAADVLKQKHPFLMIEIHSPEIGKRCFDVLKQHYQTINVLETGKAPDESAPQICHYIAYN
jgi:FkbM family methyltransferase